jgi:hypothetical protein
MALCLYKPELAFVTDVPSYKPDIIETTEQVGSSSNGSDFEGAGVRISAGTQTVLTEDFHRFLHSTLIIAIIRIMLGHSGHLSSAFRVFDY